jgi:glucokinase
LIHQQVKSDIKVKLEIIWHKDNIQGQRHYLVGDIGGTNTNLAIVEKIDARFQILLQVNYSSSEVIDLFEPAQETINIFKQKHKDQSIDGCCFSGAGPVIDNFCTLSNLSWNIDGNRLSEKLGMKTIIVNDFISISNAVPLLDINDPSQIQILEHTDGQKPEPKGNINLVIGAGTGLGVSYIIHDDSGFRAFPSEGGHASFAPFDTQTAEIMEYLTKFNNYSSEIELFVSGRGIANIFNYYKDVRKVSLDGELKDVNDAAHEDKAALISKFAPTNPVCRDILRCFIKIYGKVASDFATILLPTRGIFLAGGIVSKNSNHFADGMQFMYYFEKNIRPEIQSILKRIPVYIIKDYNVSLIGAANCIDSAI